MRACPRARAAWGDLKKESSHFNQDPWRVPLSQQSKCPPPHSHCKYLLEALSCFLSSVGTDTTVQQTKQDASPSHHKRDLPPRPGREYTQTPRQNTRVSQGGGEFATRAQHKGVGTLPPQPSPAPWGAPSKPSRHRTPNEPRPIWTAEGPPESPRAQGRAPERTSSQPPQTAPLPAHPSPAVRRQRPCSSAHLQPPCSPPPEPCTGS